MDFNVSRIVRPWTMTSLAQNQLVFLLPLIRSAVELLTRINNRRKRYTRKERIVRCCVRGYLVHCNMLGFIRQKFVLTRSLPLFCYWLVSFLITDTLCILHTARDCGPHNRVKLKLRARPALKEDGNGRPGLNQTRPAGNRGCHILLIFFSPTRPVKKLTGTRNNILKWWMCDMLLGCKSPMAATHVDMKKKKKSWKWRPKE